LLPAVPADALMVVAVRLSSPSMPLAELAIERR
jgi:hypothetical protein